MTRNIEIKARILPEQVRSILSKVMSLADQGPVEIRQTDIFFSCPNGRLKLRIFSSAKGQLIFYRRSNRTGPKESEYVIAPTSSPDLLLEALALAYGQVGRVLKTRQLFMVGRTRIHIDEVEGLSGHFIELEVVLSEEESSEAGVAVANELLETLGVSQQQLIAEAYVDLLATELPSRP